MQAITIDSFGGIEKLKLSEIVITPPNDDEVQIQIKYAAVNPVDWKIREGYLKNRLPHEFPIILGWDASGTISAIGKNVRHLNLGDEVYAYCRKPIVKWGTYAELVNVEASSVALKPKKLNFAEAAAIPLVGLTAWQALFDSVHLKNDEKILIHAGAGGVGSLAIQFAKITEAFVFTTSSKANFPYVKKLGANVTIDYKTEDFVSKIKSLEPNGIDVVLDTVGGETLLESVQLLKKNGRIVSIIEKVPDDLAKKYQIHASYVFVRPNGEQLKKIAELIDQDKVQPPKIEEMSLKDAGLAQEKLRKGCGGGKIVLKIK